MPENEAVESTQQIALNSNFTPLDRAAVLMMSLGEDDAALVLKHLGPKEVQKLGQAMVSLENVQKDDLTTVLDDFLNVVQSQTSMGVDSGGYIKSMLVSALGEDKAGGLIDRILSGESTSGLDTLKWMEPRSVADIIRYEHPQIQSIVISYLDSDQAASVLDFLPIQMKLDIIIRIAALETIQPNALRELNSILEKQFAKAANAPAAGFGGVKVSADIFNFLDSSSEAELMEQLQQTDENLAQEIQDLMFVFDNLIDVDDSGIQVILREVSSEVLIIALKAAEEGLKEKIFGNMSKRAAELLMDDLEAKGPCKVSEVEGAQKEILSIARKLAESGEIQLGGKSGEEMI